MKILYIYKIYKEKVISLPSIGQDDAPSPGSSSCKISVFIRKPFLLNNIKYFQ